MYGKNVGWARVLGGDHSPCSHGRLCDCGDCIIVGVVVVAFHHIIHILGGIPILPLCAAEGHCCEATTIRLVEERLESRVCLDSHCFPCVEFLESEDVGLDKNADGICNDLFIEI